MTEADTAAYIVSSWIRGIPAAAIMVNLICLGRPVKRADILAVIKAYVDNQSENRAPHS